MQKKYSKIKGFYRLSCKNETGIADFRKKLIEDLAAVGMQVPAERLQIRVGPREALRLARRDLDPMASRSVSPVGDIDEAAFVR